MSAVPRPVAALGSVARDSLRVWWVLLKLMVPTMILVKLAADFGAIPYIAAAFAPVMAVVGLPPELGIVWATACLTTIYGAAAVLPTVMPADQLTVAQMTVLGTMMLVAHSLPLEGRVCQRTGTSFLVQTALRLGGAVLFGAILSAVYTGLDVLQQPANMAWLPQAPADGGWLAWGIAAVESLAMILAVIFVIMAGMRLLDAVGGNRLLTRLLQPLLRLMGMGPQAVPLTVIGVVLGLSYGSGLIIREVDRGALPRRDVFLSISFMALCHSLIEDSLIIIAMGGDWTGVVLGRLLLTVVVMTVLARIVHPLPDRTFERLFMNRRGRPAAVAAPAGAA
ncbi:hypothetical protein [Caenispirillum bisanense]|uniref:Nucleoside recognition n=1 Tax=Caenispirillum bisanense TaxID=414052 RepID=A0A286G617_9PROT|nr:hypothetical protein [Caenispirillum bisanense]SOD90997.1 hypothetical protein SAMN05421508_101757 [Caenispirillum bisanense]